MQSPDDFINLIDLQAVSLLRYLSIAYGNNWNIHRAKKYFMPMPGFPSAVGAARSLGPAGKNKTIFTKALRVYCFFIELSPISVKILIKLFQFKCWLKGAVWLF